MLSRIQKGRYGQDCERELIALKYNLTVRVYDGFSKRWIVNQDVDPKDDRVIMIIWDRSSTHYDLLIPEGEDIVESRSRQLQDIFSRSSSYIQSFPHGNVHKSKYSSITKINHTQEFKQRYDEDVEEVDYGSSSYSHKKKRVTGIGIKIVLPMISM